MTAFLTHNGQNRRQNDFNIEVVFLIQKIKPKEDFIMSETKNEAKETGEVKNPLEIIFKKPYVFEGETYKSLDLSGLENMTGKEYAKIEKMLRMTGITTLNPETTPEGAYMYASQATGVPVEFFNNLPLKEAKKVKTVVVNFLWN